MHPMEEEMSHLRRFDKKQEDDHRVEIVHKARHIAPKGTGVKLIAEETDHTLPIQEIELVLQRFILREQSTPQ